jgi:hypothetical protein
MEEERQTLKKSKRVFFTAYLTYLLGRYEKESTYDGPWKRPLAFHNLATNRYLKRGTFGTSEKRLGSAKP